jgi:hypothetical protein
MLAAAVRIPVDERVRDRIVAGSGGRSAAAGLAWPVSTNLP